MQLLPPPKAVYTRPSFALAIPAVPLHRNATEPFLLAQNLRERDLTVRLQYLLITHAAHFLVRFCVDICIRCNDMIANILLDRLLEKQLANAIPEHTENSFKRFSKDLRQKVSGILALQIAAVK